ncbi:ATP-binding protein [Burkholderia gladioli]|uniref:ATP-binding protein n=1 Tax=Burkholderia gladioli TaxID=28095 RepID=UPI00163FB5DD|nr:ATP-binding protein [Burkholderia gladioli]
MFLKQVDYQEKNVSRIGSQQWKLQGLHLGQINLIVGKNSSGKTRVTNIIHALARMLAGKQPPHFYSGTWFVEFERMKGLSHEEQKYHLEIFERTVSRESFQIGRQQIMARTKDGNCFVMRKAGSERVKYKVPTNQLTAVVRRDEIQHPFFDHLYQWASNCCVYRFGTDFGKSSTTIITPSTGGEELFSTADQVDNAVHVFRMTQERFGDTFKEQLLLDLNDLGYNCTDIALDYVRGIQFNGVLPLALAVKEHDLGNYTSQGDMSQGMYRALALCIHVNANILWGQEKQRGRELRLGDLPMLIIDDIGEGLDFERSRKLVASLIRKATEHQFQLVMSSNDRFIMNDVPLEYWTVLHRKAGIVQAFNSTNAKKSFDDFEYLGLNNFDFFSGEHFLEPQE